MSFFVHGRPRRPVRLLIIILRLGEFRNCGSLS